MSDYYDGYREGMAQASRETAALREQLDAMLKSVADLKSLTMPPPPINLTIPSARKPIAKEKITEILLNQTDYGLWIENMKSFEQGIRFAEKHHDIIDADV